MLQARALRWFWSSGSVAELQVGAGLKESLARLGVQRLTEVQGLAMPFLLSHPDKHVRIVAPTGSGKSLAFLVPLAEGVLARQDRALVLTHSKELSHQAYSWARQLGLTNVLRLGSLHYYHHREVMGDPGRFSSAIQNTLKKSVPDLLILTPDQFSDIFLARVKASPPATVVIDEADLLAEADSHLSSLCQDICRTVLDRRPSSRVVLVSAQPLSQPFLGLSFHDITMLKKPPLLEEFFIQLEDPAEHQALLLELLRVKLVEEQKRVLVFFNSLQALEECALLMGEFRPAVFHAGLNANERLRRATEAHTLLLATDVASRGLDLLFDVVVQFQMPASLATYVTRVGRAARAGRRGQAYVFTRGEDEPLLSQVRARPDP
jgi:ATP-dependent RNA helicase DDX54/DBP10